MFSSKWPKNLTLLLALKSTQTMKKFIFILNALDIMAGLLKGKRYEGVLFMDMNTGLPTFKAYNRKPRVRKKDEGKPTAL